MNNLWDRLIGTLYILPVTGSNISVEVEKQSRGGAEEQIRVELAKQLGDYPRIKVAQPDGSSKEARFMDTTS